MLTTFTFGERLMIYRKRLDLSKEALAKKIGISTEQFTQYENDVETPDTGTLARLAAVFGLPVDKLVYGI